MNAQQLAVAILQEYEKPFEPGKVATTAERLMSMLRVIEVLQLRSALPTDRASS